MTKPQATTFISMNSGTTISSPFPLNGKEVGLLVPPAFPVNAAVWLKVSAATAAQSGGLMNAPPSSASFARLDYDHVTSLAWNVTTGGVPRALNLKDLGTPFRYACIELSAALTTPTSIQVVQRI